MPFRFCVLTLQIKGGFAIYKSFPSFRDIQGYICGIKIDIFLKKKKSQIEIFEQLSHCSKTYIVTDIENVTY